MPIFAPQVETLERSALERLQSERLRALVARLRTHPHYGPPLESVPAPRGLDALTSLPTTTKADLRERYPLGMLAVPRAQVARIHASSGTSGNPTIGAYTRNDLALFAEVNARALAAAGLRAGEFFQIAWGYGLFTGGLGMHGGVEALGACAVPASSGNTARQLQLLADLPVAGLGATPSYALLLAERIANGGRRPQALRLAVLGAEAWTTRMRTQIERALGVVATNVYGLSEIIGPGVAQECDEAQDGLHVQEDHFLPEILDPETLAPLPDGARGELVLTTLTREAMPVLRYRTGDLTRLVHEPCACGRTTARIGWIEGRVDEMLTIRGVNVFPTAVEEVLLRFREFAPHYRIVVERPPGELDAMTVEVERRADEPATGVERAPGALEAAAARELAESLLVRCTVRVLAPGTLERVEAGKVRRVDDRRMAGPR